MLRIPSQHRGLVGNRTPSSVEQPHTKFTRFPEANGKVVDSVEFCSSPEDNHISINFADKTCLNFSLETALTLETDYSDWKSGEQRILRTWPLIRNF